jgi:hypothetical protein
MVKANTEHVGQRGETRNVPTQVTIGPIGPDHHGHGVPAHPGAKALLVLQVAWAMLLGGWWDGIDIGCRSRKRHRSARPTGLVDQSLQQKLRPIRALSRNHGIQGGKPLLGLLRIGISRRVDLFSDVGRQCRHAVSSLTL